jgi:putative ABC transport system permease protein
MEFRPILSALLRNKFAPLLVAMQVAISLAVMANALHIVSLRYAAATRPSGVADEQNVFAIRVLPLKMPPFAELIAQQQHDKEVLRALPGVVSVATVNQFPMSQSGWNSVFATNRSQAQPTGISARYSTADSLVKTFGLQLIEGRDFTPADVQEVDYDTADEKNDKVIITKAMADALYPGAASVVGRSMFFGVGAEADEMHIIGVVQCMQTPHAATGIKGEYSTIAPIRSTSPPGSYAIRVEPGQLERVMRDAEAAIRKARNYPVLMKIDSMEEFRAKRYRDDRTLAWMLVAVSALLLLITASGIVGMTSLWISQRRKQIGVRRALGARRIDILRYFIMENLVITGGGIAAGLVLAMALNQVLVSQLELTRLPLGYLAAGGVLLWALGVLAVLGPARRASRISPATATRAA